MAQKTVFGWIVSGPVSISMYDTDKAHISQSALQSATPISYYLLNFGKMRRFLRNYRLERKKSNVRDILFLHTPARWKVGTWCGCLSKQAPLG